MGKDKGIFIMFLQPNSRGKTAYLFPGQGSQAVGMGLALYQQSTAARDFFQAVDETLQSHFSHLLFYGPEEELKQTINTQPAVMTVSLACLKAMEETFGVEIMNDPSFLAGHSLGEYTSLVAAGALEGTDAVWLVRQRGRLMQEASEMIPSGMASIFGLDDLIVEEICQQAGVEISYFNAPDQIVVAGEKGALLRAMDMAIARGARRVIPLQVSGAFHTNLMASAREGMAKAISEITFSDPRLPIIANSNATPLTSIREVKDELMRETYTSVKWQQSIAYMWEHGVTKFVEIGPGRVLTGTVRRNSDDAETVSVSDVSSIEALVR
jgi:[acyl-carrier-protein] S-malonyltransferase